MRGYTFEWDDRTSDHPFLTDSVDSVDALLRARTIKPERATVGDVEWVIEWLATYDVADDDVETAQTIANVIGLLDRQSCAMTRRAVVTAAKREYAAEHGVPVSQVRIRPTR